jgi:hypothetical protein
MSRRKCDIIHQNGGCSRDSYVNTLVFRNKVRYQNATSLQDSVWKISTSDNAIRRWLKQFQEIGSIRHRKGAGRPSTSQEDVDLIREASKSYVPRKACILKLFSICSIGSICNNIFWVTFSYPVSSFILFFPIWKLIGHGNPDNNLESLCIYGGTHITANAV